MTNDELIRQVATEIRQHHHSGTMEEALDAARAVIDLIGNVQDKYDQANAITLDVIQMLASPYADSRLPYVAGYLAEIDTLRLSAQTGEDYQLLSTAPQVVEEVIEPQGWTAEDYGKVVKEYAEEQRNANALTTKEDTTRPEAGQ